MKKAKFNGVNYDVKPTGKTSIRKVGTHDFNGYENDKSYRKTEQMGMYNPDTGEKDYTVSGNNVYSGSGKPVGSVKIKEEM